MKYLNSIVVMLIVISLSGCLSSENVIDNQNNIEEENNNSTELEMVEIFLSHLDTESLEDDAYYAFIINEDYEVLKTYIFYEEGRKRIKWNGKDEAGVPYPDGLYHVIIYTPSGITEYVSRIFIKSSKEQDEGTVE